MLESDMEELIAQYPAEFFPRSHFTLAGRQGSVAGIGRYDLLFDDSRGVKSLMELEARPAGRDDADGLATRNNALKLGGHKGIVLWLVATNIQHSVGEALDSVGVQHTEIPVAEYYRVAEKYGYEVTYEKAVEIEPPRPARARGAVAGASVSDGHTRSVVRPKFEERRATLEKGFEAAHRFLMDLGEDHYPDFRISTDKNAHLYYSKDKDDHNAFYAYIVLKPEERAIELLSRPNAQWWGKPVTKAGLLFGPKLDGLVAELGGKHRWAVPERLGYTLTNKTPPEFFARLLQLIRHVHK